MKNQFFYKRVEEEKTFTDSFNVNKAVRSVGLEDGRTLVLLDDLHERSQEVPEIDVRTNKVKGIKRQRDTFQSEIYLDAEDATRFKQLTSL
jgi:hypothetical protein